MDKIKNKITGIKKSVPAYIRDIAEKLQENNYEAYLVGGSIRDIMLGKVPQDYDIATNAYPEEIEEVFPKSIPTGAQFGTITVITRDENGESFDVEITTFRSEADYIGGRWPSRVEYARTIQQDLSRRDFTINAMALNLKQLNEAKIDMKGLLVDPYEGARDLGLGVIRAVGKPEERFSEDGLRSVRACRLAAQLGFKIDPMTFGSIHSTLHITKKVSVERFRDELMKLLLKAPKPSTGLRLMKESGILQLFIPELLEGVDVYQPEFHADDVFDHTLKTVDLAEDRIKLPALFHDIGKPRTKTEDESGIHFYGHDKVGEDMTREIMKRLKFSNLQTKKVSKLVRWHMFFYPSADWRKEAKAGPKGKSSEQINFKPDELSYLSDDEIETRLKGEEGIRLQGGWTDGAIRRLIINVGGDEAVEDLMKLRLADALANPKLPFNRKEIDALAERISKIRAMDMAMKVTDLDISGNDIMKEFNLEPGKIVGDILKELLEIVIDDPIKNKKDTLLEAASKMLKKKKV